MALLRFLIFSVMSSISTFAKLENMSMEDFLSYLNPPSLEKLLDEDGYSILCVSLEDPWFKRGKEGYLKRLITSPRIGGKTVKCPQNTYALKELTKEYVESVGGISAFLKNSSIAYGNKVIDYEIRPSYEYALMEYTSQVPVTGTSAILSIWKPLVSKDGHFSLSQVWVMDKSRKQTLEAGWHVYPEIYGDDKPRFFLYWTADGYELTGCYNLECDGFQVAEGFNFTHFLKPLNATSYMDDGQYEFSISITLLGEGERKGWYLIVRERYVGFWPSSLFRDLGNEAWIVQYGGEVTYTPNNLGKQCHEFRKLQMGSGHFPWEGWGGAASIRRIKFSGPVNEQRIATKPHWYDVNSKPEDDFGGRHLFFGGPGRDNTLSCL